MGLIFSEKQIMNPSNPEEVFECKDLVSGKSSTVSLINRRLLPLPKGEVDEYGKTEPAARLLRVPHPRK